MLVFRIISIAIILLLQFSCVKAQVYYTPPEVRIDSIENLLPQSRGAKRVHLLNQLSYHYRLSDKDRSLTLALEAYEIAETLSDQLLIGEAAYYLGTAYHHSGNYPMAIRYALDAMEKVDPGANPMFLLPRVELIVMIYLYSNNKDLALETAFMAYKQFCQNPNPPHIQFEFDIRMGWVYMMAGKYRAAIPYLRRVLSNQGETGLIPTASFALNISHLAVCYLKTEQYDSSIYMSQLANSYRKRYNLKALDEILNDLGKAYYEMGKLDSAAYYCQKALDVHTTNDYYGASALSYIQLGKIAIKEKDWHKAKDYFSKAIVQGNLEIESKSISSNKQTHQDMWYSPLQDVPEFIAEKGLKQVMIAHQFSTEVCKALEDYKRATFHLEAYLEAKKKQDLLVKQRDVVEFDTRYETERKQQKILLLEKDNELARATVQQTRFIFIGISGFLIIILLFVLLFLRQNRLKAEQEKTGLQQKLLRSQMNPHFLYNSLASIQNFIVTEDPDNASVYLSRFSNLVRNILDSSIEEYVPLEKEINTIKNYLELQKVRYVEKLDYILEVDDQLDLENMQIPPMLAQPFIENAIEHGIKYKQDKGHVLVRFSKNGDQIIFAVEDDGVGREKAVQIQQKQDTGHRSLATVITRERIKILNKKRKEKITLTIEDLKDSSGQATGTRVRFEIPVG
nr:histidine kinase [Bacteroidota bacterium]